MRGVFLRMKVSLIIPVYNTEKVILNKCFQSIQNQTFKDYEVVIVDDGSSDKCAKYLDEIVSEKLNYHVIHQSNGGPSNARNTGLDNIKGEFFCFIDADDYMSDDYIEKLVDTATSTGSDIVIANMIVIDEKDNEEIGRGENKYNCSLLMSGKNRYNVIQQFFHRVADDIQLEEDPFQCKSNQLWMHVMIWGRMYRKATLGNIRFVSKVIFSEDNIFCLDSLIACKKLAFVKNTYYYYYANEASISHRYSKFDVERYVDYFVALQERLYEWPEFFNAKYTAMMLGILKSRTQNDSFLKTYLEVKSILNFEDIKQLSKCINMNDCAHNQEKRTRYCLIHDLPFLLSVFILLGRLKSKWKERKK